MHLRESGDLEQYSTRHQKCPSAKLDRREQKNYRGKKCFGVQGVLKSCTRVLEETARASLFSNLLKASNRLSVYPVRIDVFNTLLEKMLGSIRISPCF